LCRHRLCRPDDRLRRCFCPTDVASTIAKTPSLSTLSGLLASAGLTETLKTGGPYTVFAPSDDAFKAVPAKTMDDLAKHPEN